MNIRILILSLVLLVSVIGVIAVINDNNSQIGETPAVDAQVDSSSVNIPADAPTITDLSKVTGHIVNRIDSCKDEKYVESLPQYANCTNSTKVCDYTNQSCHTEDTIYECYKGAVNVEKSVKNCKTNGYKIGKNKLNTGDYVCKVDDLSDSTTVICDSKYDGNGDGICTSGESCMKFIITDKGMEVYKKNSKDEFVKNDPTFFLDEISTEVEE